VSKRKSSLVKILFSLLLFFNLSFAATQADLNSLAKYKKEYFSALLNGDKQKEYNSLKQIIHFSKRLGKPTNKYTKELKLLEKNIKQIPTQTSQVKKVVSKKQEVQKEDFSSKQVYKKKYNAKKNDTIQSIEIEKNKIVFHFKKNIYRSYVKYTEYKSRGFFRDNFDIRGTFTGVNKLKLQMPQVKNVKKLVIYKSKAGKIRLSIRGKKNLKTIYILGKKTLTIKVLEPISKREVQIKQNFKTTYVPSNNDKVIVIDAGHGGKDVGAVGPYKRYEKVATLKVSKQLAQMLKQRGYKVYMTRTNDRFKTLKYRTRYANKKKADLFISIHANSVPKSKAKKAYGIETYYLSPARSERAKRVAAKENKVDMDSMGYGTKNIFLMTLNRAKINASQKLALDVQNNMLHNLKKNYNRIKDKGVRKGPFWILVGAQMPAILIEIGFMSHPLESKRLYDYNYQKQLALGIANGVDSYFMKNE
jgi:N-acetylmuramoyl-L-alanine amidase